MKNTTQLLALGLVLFLGSCSVVDGKFLDKVKGKTASKLVALGAPEVVVGTFSSDGKRFDWNNPPYPYEGMTFVEASDENTGTYRLPDGKLSIIKMADGKMGDLSGTGGPISFFLK